MDTILYPDIANFADIAKFNILCWLLEQGRRIDFQYVWLSRANGAYWEVVWSSSRYLVPVCELNRIGAETHIFTDTSIFSIICSISDTSIGIGKTLIYTLHI